MTTVAITGNTYPIKDALKALGGRWNADRKAWMVPADRAGEARSLVAGTPAKSARNSGSSRRRGTWTGCFCGSVSEFSKPSDCWTCKHDA